MKTRAAIIEEKGGPFRIETVDLAEPGAGEVRVRMEACGICRSDLAAMEGGEGMTFPAVLGHEGAGVVEALGSGVTLLKAGNRVILSWTPACGDCPPCRRGEVQLCRGLRMSTRGEGPLSHRGRSLDRYMGLGGFSEHLVVPEKMAIPIESEMPSIHACLIGCGVMTGFGAATKTAALREGESVAVLGCGGVGLSAVQGARFAGAGRIFAIDPIAERREAALHVGATDALDVPDAISKVVAQSGGGVDAAIECVGKSEAMRDAFRMIRPGGRAVVVGLTDFKEKVELPAIHLLSEKSIKGSVYGSANPAQDFPHLVALYDQGLLDLDSIAEKTRPLAEINEGVAEMRSGKTARVVLTF